MSGNNEAAPDCKEDATSKTTITKARALELCQDLLGGAWKHVSSEDMIFRTVTGGLCNHLYYCSLPENTSCSEPREVVIREYGSFSDSDSIVNESVVVTILSERKLVPKLYGVFPGGRIEEYIPTLPLTHSQLRDPAISESIARKMAKIHSLNMPFSKKPTWMDDIMKSWMDRAQANVDLTTLSPENKALADNLWSRDLDKEFDWLRSFLAEIDSPIVFCHNDLQKGNILLPDGPEDMDDRLMLIDFEFCSYNFRGFDLALHFNEWGYDYTLPVHPNFRISDPGFPSKQEKLRYIRAYLTALGQSSAEEELHLLEETDRFMLAAHLLAMAWSLCAGYTSSVMNFGHFEHATSRLESYFRWKKHLLQRTTAIEGSKEELV